MKKKFSVTAEDLVGFYGVNDSNFELIKSHFSNLKITGRGNCIVVEGDEKGMLEFEIILKEVFSYIEKRGMISEKDMIRILIDEGKEEIASEGIGIILTGNKGKVVKARTPNQLKLVKSYDTNDLIFAIGPAGTGKTYTAVALAVRALKNKEIKRIVLTRPAVEAGENLGFLPGDVKEKLEPYLRPLYDALRDMIAPEKLRTYMEDGTIEIAPLAYMRGRTLDNAFVILDEAQNATSNQLKMFLTRMGETSKFLVTGDVTQIDLPSNQKSGLVQATKIMSNISGIDFIFLDSKDIIRHKLVSRIVKAYNKEN